MPRSRRVQILVSARGLTLVPAWIFTVLAAGAAGWYLGRSASPGNPAIVQAARPEPSPATQLEPPPPPAEPLVDVPEAVEPPAQPESEPAPTAPRPTETEPTEAPAVTARESTVEPPPPEQPIDVSEPEPLPVAEPDPPEPSVWVRALQAARRAEQGDTDIARAAAARLVADYPSYTELVAVLEEDGAGEIEARLTTLRMLQIAGHDAISRELARGLRRSYAGTEQVSAAIARWGILKPFVTDVESTIHDGRVRVTGMLHNPDIAGIRSVEVQIVALDAAGNTIGTTKARVRPKVIDPESSASFTGIFRQLDPSLILRTRSAVVSWEVEVLR